MKYIYPLVILVLLVLQSSCGNSNVVSSNRLIQKRKFNKGFFISLPRFLKNDEGEAQNNLEIKKEDLVVNASDTALYSKSISKFSSEKQAEVITDNSLMEEERQIQSYNSKNRMSQLSETEPEQIKEDPDPVPENSESNQFRWALVTGLFLAVIAGIVGITAIALESLVVIAAYLLVIGAFILILTYLNQTKEISRSERFLFALDLLFISAALVIAGLFAFGWTFIFIGISGLLFALILAISVVKFVKLNKSLHANPMQPSNAKKMLLWIGLSIVLLFAISAILYNTIGAYGVLIILTALIGILFISALIYSIVWARSTTGGKRVWPILTAIFSALFAVFAFMSFAGQL